jgi:hypothetical protein
MQRPRHVDDHNLHAKLRSLFGILGRPVHSQNHIGSLLTACRRPRVPHDP